MNRYLKISAALAAFALLLVVMGLSTQNVANAQLSVGSAVQSCDPYPDRESATDTTNLATSCPATGGDNVITISGVDVADRIEVYNTNLPEFTALTGNDESGVAQEGTTAGDNPRVYTGQITYTLYAVSRTSFLRPFEIKAFTGNVIRITHRPTGSIGTVETVTVDNVDPQLVITAPTVPLVVKGGVDITFSADIADTGSGYVTDSAKVGLDATAANLTEQTVAVIKGAVRLVVAGNVVKLTKSNLEAIDDGWRVTVTINSTVLQDITANVPWYFETRDLAGNTRRTSGNVEFAGTAATATAVTSERFKGLMPNGAFERTSIKASLDDPALSNTVPVDMFDSMTGVFTVAGAWFESDDATDIAEEQQIPNKFELVNTNLITVDSRAPGFAKTTGTATTGRGLVGTSERENRKNSIKVEFADDSKAGDGSGSGLDSSTVTASAFSVSGNTVTSAVLGKNNVVYLTLAESLGSTETPKVTVAGGLIKDKAGNAFTGSSQNAIDGLGPNLSVSKSADLSNTKVDLTISSDEQLKIEPAVTLGWVVDGDGNLGADGVRTCLNNEGERVTDAVVVPEVLEDTNNNIDAVAEHCQTADGTPYEGATPGDDPRVGKTADVTQRTALTYSTSLLVAGLGVENGGKFNVYVEGTDTQGDPGNSGTTGTETSANKVGSFSFQLDEVLNGGVDPTVTVSDKTAADGGGDDPDVEAVDPMIVTVDFAKESGEYAGDSYRTVELTSAELTVTFADGTDEKTTFNLTTNVSTADWIKYTIPLLNPKVGSYSLTVKAVDSAGNASGTTGHTSRWNVIAAKPVNIALEPGWNLVSLPFQPGNPAINSVIATTHPADIVMTYDNASRVWLVSRRDAETGLFVGDIVVMTANTAYFIRTDKFQALKILRPPLATAAAAPPPPPAISVVEGWNLVPIVSNDIPTPKTIPADDYFGTLGEKGWLKALTFNTLVRTWESVTPGETVADGDDADELPDPATVTVGKGYWLYATEDGVIIP